MTPRRFALNVYTPSFNGGGRDGHAAITGPPLAVSLIDVLVGEVKSESVGEVRPEAGRKFGARRFGQVRASRSGRGPPRCGQECRAGRWTWSPPRIRRRGATRWCCDSSRQCLVAEELEIERKRRPDIPELDADVAEQAGACRWPGASDPMLSWAGYGKRWPAPPGRQASRRAGTATPPGRRPACRPGSPSGLPGAR